MGTGWQEWPLIWFTVLGQCVVGGFIVMGLARMAGHYDAGQYLRLHRWMSVLWLLMGLAFLASVLHLGTPLRALNSLNRLGSSGLSNEIAAGSLFFAAGGLYWLLTVTGRMPRALGKGWLGLAMALGLVFVYAMTRVYRIDTVPTWNNGYTALNFFLTVLIGGPLLGALLLRAAGIEIRRRRMLVTLSLAALLVSMGAAVMQSAGLAAIQSSVQQSAALVPWYGELMALRLALVVLGLGCWIWPMLRRVNSGVAGLALGFALVVAGELVARGVFYGLHMTVGMAVAG